MRTIAIATALLAFGPMLFAQQVREVTTAEALQMMEQGAIFVDVRETDEVAAIAYPVAGVVNIPSSTLQDRQAEVPKSGKVILACASGYRSGEAVKQLSAQGHDNLYSLKGGIVQWQRDGQPVVRPMNATGKPCCSPDSKTSCEPRADGTPCCADGAKKQKKQKKGKQQCCADGAPATPGCCEKK